jgi:N-acetylmuramic acid 6-phosphate etherase
MQQTMTTAMAAEPNREPTLAKRVLGIEGGGTKTEWVLAELTAGAPPRVVGHGFLEASNMKLVSDAQLSALFAVMPADAEEVGVFLAGCATAADRARLQRLACAAWPQARIAVGSDRDSAFATAFGQEDGIVIIAGTGAAVHGRVGAHTEKAGGWGQLLGDRGSGYHLTMQALRQVLTHYDLTGEVSRLAQTVLRKLALNELRDLVDWVMQADKKSVARLAPAVFEAAANGDAATQRIIEEGAQTLTEFTVAVAQRLGAPALPVKLFGGLFVHHPEYAELFRKRLARAMPQAKVTVCADSGALGAAWLADREAEGAPCATLPSGTGAPADRALLAKASTEQRNPRSTKLDTLSTRELVELFIAEEAYVAEALAGSSEAITRAVDLVAARMKNGGRLFYVGAGTSGRLGVLDASEIPPTFGASPELVQGVMAGGVTALHRAVEGAEDQPQAGAWAMRDRGVTAADVVCGIAASGRTPFVLGALAEARRLGAATILLTCNPERAPSAAPWEVEIDLATGPELVTGSTRLKAGTETKLVLNILSTGGMVRMGTVRGSLMVNVQVTNEKLRDRGARLVSEALGVSYEEALARLERAGWSVRAALGSAD